jgi:transposase
MLRHGIVYCEARHAWTQRHHKWLARQSFDQPTIQFALDLAVERVLLAEARRDRLEKAITDIAYQSQWTPVVLRMAACVASRR